MLAIDPFHAHHVVMKTDPTRDANEQSRQAWDANAAFWDERMGEGNDFVNVLTWPQPYFHRPLEEYLQAGFRCGFVLDGFEERAFPSGHPQGSPLGWGGLFSEFPAVVVARVRLSGPAAA